MQMIRSVYIHIPYCQHICHYCDFAKTANYLPKHLEQYAHAISRHLNFWIPQLKDNQQWPEKLDTVYFGGGTPGLLQDELRSIMDVVLVHCDTATEITLETNPNLCDPGRIKLWQDLGVSRLSIGVQSFDSAGLKALHRDHEPETAFAAIQEANKHFNSTNLDLIYGWPGQTIETWGHDIDRALQSGATHISAYALTFASGTAMGRAFQRGRLPDTPTDDLVSDFYETLRHRLSVAGWDHYEVSNWAASPDFRSKHNLAYWTGAYYLGIGSGAHGYLPDKTNPIGIRYSYHVNDRKFLLSNPEELIEFEKDRDRNAWLIEYVGNGLRQAKGVDLMKIQSLTGLIFKPDAYLTEAMQCGHINISDHRLLLHESMWFLEIQWAHKVLACFH